MFVDIDRVDNVDIGVHFNVVYVCLLNGGTWCVVCVCDDVNCTNECSRILFDWYGGYVLIGLMKLTLRSGGTVANEVYLRRGYC